MTTLPLPSAQSLARAVTELSAEISAATLKRAHFALLNEIKIHIVAGGFYVPSFTSGDVHFVSHLTGCDCKARKACKHEIALRLIEVANAHTARPTFDAALVTKLVRERLFADPPAPEPPAVGDGPGEDYPPPEYRRPLRQTAAQSVSDLFG